MVKYMYDAWGNCSVSVIDSTAATVANLNPFRYRSYYYDTETNLYFLKTRYYDPEIGRFMTIDGVSYVDPDSINGLNLYAYCGDNPVMAVDYLGNTSLLITVYEKVEAIWKIIAAIVKANPIQHNVPLYNQGSAPLCWAYSEIMIKDYEAGVKRSAFEVRREAEDMSKDRNGKIDVGIPKDAGICYLPENIYELYFIMLIDGGPIYAYYKNPTTTAAHYIVVTGVDVKNNIIYTNNPWGVQGTQTFQEFIDGVATTPGGSDKGMDLYWISTSGGFIR